MLKLLSLFKILAGLPALFLSIGFGVLSIGLIDRVTPEHILEAFLMFSPIGIAGILYICSGIILITQHPVIHKRVITLSKITLIFCIFHCLLWFMQFRENLFDEEAIILLYVPGLSLLFIVFDIIWLARQRSETAQRNH